jgi:hypothetical protein
MIAYIGFMFRMTDVPISRISSVEAIIPSFASGILIVAIVMVVSEWLALRRIIRHPIQFFIIVMMGWFLGAFIGLWLVIALPATLSILRTLILISGLWGGTVGLAQMIAWSPLVRRAYLWFFTEWLFIFVLLVIQLMCEAIFRHRFPDVLAHMISALVAGAAYGGLTSFVLLWQVKHPIFGPAETEPPA